MFPVCVIIIGEDSFDITTWKFGIDWCLQCDFQGLVHSFFLENIILFSTCKKDSLYPASRSRVTMELSPHPNDISDRPSENIGSLIVGFVSLVDNSQVDEDHKVRVDNWFDPWIKISMTSLIVLSPLSFVYGQRWSSVSFILVVSQGGGIYTEDEIGPCIRVNGLVSKTPLCERK